MKRIVFVINYITKSGPSDVLKNIIFGLDKTAFDITLMTLFEGNDSSVVDEVKKNGVNVITCHTLTRIGCMLGMAKEFSTVIAEVRPDIIHTHGIIPDILSSKLNTKAKRVATIHNNMLEDYLDCYGRAKSAIFIAMHLHALRRLDYCVCCSKSVYDAMKPYISQLGYIRNGIGRTNSKLAITRNELGIPDSSMVLIYAGALNTGKNILWLIKKFVKAHTAEEYLIVLGSGEQETLCKEAADNHVLLLGFQSDPNAYYKISDVYVSASRSEGFSISVLEALDTGLELLLSDIPSHREVFEMSGKIYIGELFKKDSFENALSNIRKSAIDKNTISAFKQSELSDSRMVSEYADIYNRN